MIIFVKNYLLLILVIALNFISCSGYLVKKEPKSYREAEDVSQIPAIVKRSKSVESMRDSSQDNLDVEQKSVIQQQEAIYNQENTTKRQIIYESQLNIQVRRIEHAIDNIKSIIDSYKGYIESSQIHQERNEARIKIRVPVDKFFNALDDLFKIGYISSYQIRAEDVTKKLQDVELRFNTLKKLRDRLYELFKNVKDVKQKAKILKEINRLTAEIEELEAKQKFLKDKATYSTIEVYLSTKEREENSIVKISPFDWIRKIDPLKRTIFNTDLSFYESFVAKEIFDSIKIPSDFFNNKEKFIKNDDYIIYNSSGVGIRVGFIENEPVGSKDFWLLALKEEFLKRKYNILMEKKGSKLNYLHTEIIDGVNQYYYTIGIWTKHSRDKSYVVINEIYYPEKEYFEKYKKTIEELF